MQIRRDNNLETEIPMGPLIDIVFLLLVFFLVTAKPIKPESDVGLTLPGTVAQEEMLEIPDEQRIEIQPGGTIVLNYQPLGQPSDRRLDELVRVLRRFREMNEANRAASLVTVDAAAGVKHQRIIDVLNACAAAGITGVTFATEDEEILN
jgi:biopolymer transport protein ExbD